MKKTQKRLNFSIIRLDGYYRIQCDETLELMSGKIKTLKKAKHLLKTHVDTNNFLVESKNMTKSDISETLKIFKGRLRPLKKPWTIEEATLIASIYDTRGELYSKNPKCYMSSYQKGWLDKICAHMKSSRKVNKYVFSFLNPNVALAKLFDYQTHLDFCKESQGAYNALRRYGVDTVELFDNLDSADYLKNIIKQLASDTIDRATELNAR